MSESALAELVAQMLAMVMLHPAFAQPITAPAVHRVPHEAIAQHVCKTACAARAYYLPRDGVFIDTALDLASDHYARSILFHEIVHHAQEVSGRYSHLDDCRRWLAREEEAYVLQNAYLREHKSATTVHNMLKYVCPGHDSIWQ